MPACLTALTKRAVCHGAGVSPGALARLQEYTFRHSAVSRSWELVCSCARDVLLIALQSLLRVSSYRIEALSF
jgi:hypothetical protein